MTKLLLTGATGFVGQALLCELAKGVHFSIRIAVRSRIQRPVFSHHVEQVYTGDLNAKTDYLAALNGVDIVIHAAARAHVLGDDGSDPLMEFRKVNVEGTLNLARQAFQQGVKRFVFISSIGVNGNNNEVAFVESNLANPQEPYAISKYETELALRQLSKETGMEVVIIRPPLVYGPNAPGNFGSLVRWVNKGIPLPLGCVCNQRSFIALDNLVNFIVLCAEHPKAAGEVFLISDGEDVSTTKLLQKVAKAMDQKARLIPVPVGVMIFIAKFLGKEDVANRLFASLQVDSSKARELLGWKPVVMMDEQLKKIMEAKQ